MFEQSVLRPARVRGWAVTVGFMGELVAVACVLAVPLMWPQLLPRTAAMTWLMAPVLTPPPAIQPARAHPIRPIRDYPNPIFVPVSVQRLSPTTAETLPDLPPEIGVVSGLDTPANTSEIHNLLNGPGPTPPSRPTTPPAASTPKTAPSEPKAIRVSGNVQAALLIYRVDPVYPRLAQQVHVSGTVELNGIIGADGHIRELHATSGNPLLVPAALEAVRQWVYRPTLLGGEPVEVITTISVIFQLR